VKPPSDDHRMGYAGPIWHNEIFAILFDSGGLVMEVDCGCDEGLQNKELGPAYFLCQYKGRA
jgi:hypothetical protein